MAKNIAVSDDVYELLSRLKLPNESFSDTIKRLAKKPRLSEIAGSKTVTKEEWAKVEEMFRRQKQYDIRRKKSLLERTR
jgi:predicted CopG family antitoxin